MKKVILKSPESKGGQYTYDAESVLFRGDFLIFVDKKSHKRTVPVSRLIEILEEVNEIE